MALKRTISAPDAPEDYPKTLSKGERLFNWLTYGGIAGMGVFLGTIPITYWAKYGKGAKLFARAAKNLEKTGMSAKSAEDVMMVTALMQGGNIGIIPVKAMENHKPKIVEKFNKILGEKDAEVEVEQEPKQTWMSLIKARIFLAWTPVFLSFKAASSIVGADKFAAYENKFSEYVVCRPLGKPTHIAGQETKLFRTGKIAALDAFATAAAAALLYIGSRIFAERKPKKEDIAPPGYNAPTKNNAQMPATAEDCLPCRLKSFASSISPSESFARTVASEKLKAADSHPQLV